MLKTLSIDIETYSSVDLTKTGVYKYAEAEDFEILLFAYAYDDDPVQIIDLASGETIPVQVYGDLDNPTVLKTAFNANFEITCIQSAVKKMASPTDWRIGYLSPGQWECTMVKSAMLGLPMSLDGVAKALNLEQQKMAAGRALIRYFSMPCKPTKSNGMRTRNLPHHDPDKWELFKEYCKQDVETERAIRNKERWFTIPQKERELWLLDQRIIGTGVLIDRRMVENAIRMDDDHKEILTAEATELTGLDNPNSPAQLKEWLTEQTGEEVTSLTKTAIPELMGASDSEEVTRVLELRQEMAKTSTKKYQAMLDAVCTDGRVRGLLQFYGASRTGRWAGRLVQVQNLPQNHLPDLDLARTTVVEGDRELVEMLYGNVPDTLSQLIRTAFVAPEGHRFIVADFSAIEARVTAWLAGEKWRLDVFASHGKIYEASASQMFKVPLDSIDKGSPLRQKGKIAELACIAKGQLVITDRGMVPIEQVTTQMEVWDGEKFVRHKGVIYKGLKKVIEYEGLKATEDHLVWVEGKHRPIPFGDAARSGSRLLKPRNGGKGVRKRKDHKPGAEIHQGLVGALCANRMFRVWQKGMDNLRKFNKGFVKRVPNVFSSETNTQMAGSPFNRCQTEMRKPERRKLQKLRGSWHRVSIWLNFRGGAMDDRGQRLTGATHGAGQNRRKWTLRKGEFKVGYTPRELPEPTPVYDILECGEKNRFVVSGVLVHNCGYGGGVGALKAMGADKMGLSDEELQETITQWRAANPNIVRLWYDIQEAAMAVIGNIGRTVEVRGCRFKWDKGLMWITLPSGRSLCYATPGIGRNRFGGDSITYWGINQTTRKWEKQETYGGKLVENLSQAIARDCLAHSMLRLAEEGFKIVMHVHDEVVIEEPYDGKTMDEACRIMGEPIGWAPGLLLRADGYETEYYKKD